MSQVYPIKGPFRVMTTSVLWIPCVLLCCCAGSSAPVRPSPSSLWRRQKLGWTSRRGPRGRCSRPSRTSLCRPARSPSYWGHRSRSQAPPDCRPGPACTPLRPKRWSRWRPPHDCLQEGQVWLGFRTNNAPLWPSEENKRTINICWVHLKWHNGFL